jgi:hypothetical protein
MTVLAKQAAGKAVLKAATGMSKPIAITKAIKETSSP